MKIIKKEKFYIPFSQEGLILPYYSKLENKTSKTLFTSLNNCETKYYSNNSVSISLFPSYLTPSFNHEGSINIITIPQKKIIGYAITIKEACDVKTFLQNEFKKKFKNNILRFVNRFENCFTPSYKMFFGEISDTDYYFLMGKLKDMLSTRFTQKNDSANTLQYWDYYKNASLELINSKKASLFVIYVNGEPVQITLNHHYNDILFVSIPSYDINYSKFALGNIAIYKLLEWALENDYKMLDMAYGDLEYKRRWSNYTYQLEHHILYKKGNIFKAALAQIEACIIKTKNKLKDKNLDTYIKQNRTKNNKKEVSFPLLKFDISEVIEVTTSDLISVDLITESNPSIKKILYDFLYVNKEHINNVEIYKSKTLNDFFIIGKHIKKKVSF